MKIKKFKNLITLMSLLVFTSYSFAKEPLKVGYIYSEEIGDYGWTYQHELARQKVDSILGDKISSSYVVTTKKDALSTIDKMVKDKYDMIFVTSVGLKAIALKAAKANPDVKFSSCNSDYSLKNLEGYTARYDEGYYLAGVASAKVTNSKVLGAVGILDIPLIYRNVNAFTLGAQSVNPDITVKAIWINSRNDTEAEAEAVRKLKVQGVDIILQQTINPTVLTVAEEEDLWVVGFNGVAKKYAPTKYLTSVLNDWSRYYEKQIKNELNSRWKSKNTWAGFSQGMIAMTAFNPIVPKKTKAEIKKMRAEIRNGELHPFKGPIDYADGQVFIKDGEVPRFHMILGMKKFIKGIETIYLD